MWCDTPADSDVIYIQPVCCILDQVSVQARNSTICKPSDMEVYLSGAVAENLHVQPIRALQPCSLSPDERSVEEDVVFISSLAPFRSYIHSHKHALF